MYKYIYLNVPNDIYIKLNSMFIIMFLRETKMSCVSTIFSKLKVTDTSSFFLLNRCQQKSIECFKLSVWLSFIDYLNIYGNNKTHTVIQIIGDGASLFRSLSYILNNNQERCFHIRQRLVLHEIENWDRFPTFFKYNNGDSYL